MKSTKISNNNRRTWKDSSIRNKRVSGMIKKYWGTDDLKFIYNTKIRPLILEGYVAKHMVNINGLNVSDSSIKNVIKKYASKEDLEILKNNRKQLKSKNAKIYLEPTYGHSKGKTYDEIMGPDKAACKKKQASELWKNNNPRKYWDSTKISKGQRLLYEKVKLVFNDAEIEYPVDAPGKKYYLDVAVPSLKLNFEYDGFYWHSFPDAVERDKNRDEYLKSIGWKIFRYSFNAKNDLEVRKELDKLNITNIQNYDKFE